MKVLILAWGLWTRLSEETTVKPKPMVEVWWKPILWHIMKTYAHYGHKDFIIALWYKGYYIKEWFSNYLLHNSDVTVDLKNNSITVHNNRAEDWKVTLVDTWNDTQTWWRIKKIIESWYIEDEEFMMTYWDGVSDININELLNFHKKYNKLVTITAVQAENRFWKLSLNGDEVIEFWEKKDNVWQYINWGYMVLNKKISRYIDDSITPFEKAPLENLVKDGELMAYKHNWFWFAMDTLKNKLDLEEMWKSWNAPWAVFK